MPKRLWPLFFSLTVFQAIFADEIHNAVKNGDKNKVRELLDSGKAHINDQDNLGRTPLHWASMNEKDSDLAFILVMNYEADPKVRDRNGSRPSHFAASNGNGFVLGKLLRYSTAINVEADSEVAHLLEKPAKFTYSSSIYIFPHHCEEVNTTDGQGRTHLHLATYYGHKEAVKYLLDYGANKNLEDNDGNTALEIALEKGHEEIIDMLRTRSRMYYLHCILPLES